MLEGSSAPLAFREADHVGVRARFFSKQGAGGKPIEPPNQLISQDECLAPSLRYRLAMSLPTCSDDADSTHNGNRSSRTVDSICWRMSETEC